MTSPTFVARSLTWKLFAAQLAVIVAGSATLALVALIVGPRLFHQHVQHALGFVPVPVVQHLDKAFSEALGQSQAAAEKWIDGAEDNFSMSVENFCKWVKEYLDSKGPQHRVVFLVDEVGQFIGNDSHLMLNLQTITEDLGTVCGGRAWVVVTSQEDIDAVLGDLRSTKSHDFSKIQARFKTRLSLCSANVDEVIQERLLAKVAETDPAARPVGWWDYESPEPRDHHVFEPVQLLEMGVLRPDELEAARQAIERWATAPGRDPAEAARAMAARPGPRRD